MILLGTTLDNEAGWDAPAFLTPIIESLTSHEATPDFTIESEFCEVIFDTGLGEVCTDKEWEFWKAKFRECFSGDEGRRRLRMSCMSIRDRERLYDRVHQVRCPVLWLHVGISRLSHCKKDYLRLDRSDAGRVLRILQSASIRHERRLRCLLTRPM